MRSGLTTRRAVAIGVAAVIVIAVAVGAVWAFGGSGSAKTGASSTYVVKQGDLTDITSAAGTVQPINSRALTFGTSGTVQKLRVKAGGTVEVGEVLAELDPTDAQAAVDSAQQALDAANTNLALAEQQAASPKPTATATCQAQPAAYILGHTSPTPSPTPTPTPAAPTPTPAPTKTAKAPTPTKAGGGGSTPTGCSDRGGSGQGGGSGGSGTIGGGSGGSGQDSLLRAEQTVNNDTLALEQAQAKLDGTTITSPIDGRVLSIAGAVGDTVSAGGSGFIVLGGADSLAIQASFSEADVAAIQIGQKATVTLADHPGTTYHATVTQIDPAGTTSSTLVKYGVQLAFDPVPSGLLLGQTANVAVITGSITNVMYVPTAAITTTAGGTSTVTVRTASGDVTRTVTTGFEGDQGIEIKSGLALGDVVVLPGS